jgi:hypothetical protein
VHWIWLLVVSILLGESIYKQRLNKVPIVVFLFWIRAAFACLDIENRAIKMQVFERNLHTANIVSTFLANGGISCFVLE